MFEKYDKNADGSLSRDELKRMMTDFMNKETISEAELDRALNEADENKDDQIHFYEFVGVMTGNRFKTAYSDEKLKQVFDWFDDDHSGSIDKFELYFAMRTMGKKYSNQEVDDLYSKFDCNKDGELSFEEFKKFVKVALGSDNISFK